MSPSSQDYSRLPHRIVFFGAVIVAAAAISGFATGAQAALVISSAPTANVSCTANSCTQTGKGAAVLNVTQLQTLLASSSVSVNAKNGIMIGAEITWASTSKLTLSASEEIVINKPIVVTGQGGLALGNGFQFGAKGNITFWSTSSSFSIAPNNTSYTLVNSIAALASAIAAHPAGNYALANSYNASSDGTYTSSPIPIGGNFLGLNNTISHLSISDTVAGHQVGLFGTIFGSGSSVSWLHLTSARVRGGNDSQVGGIAGVNSGNVSYVSVEGTISTGKGTTVSTPGAVAGGIAGVNYYGIMYSYAAGKVNGGKNAMIGGVVGANAVQSGQSLGGEMDLTYSTADVSLDSEPCGNGCKAGSLQNSAGGLVGVNNGAVINSYATGSVTGTASANLGGLVGLGVSGTSNGIIVSYSTGAVSGGLGSSIGGLLGFDQVSDKIEDTYWDTTTSNVTNPNQGAGNISNESGIAGLTTAQLQSGLPAGFNDGGWGEDANINGGLPYLLAIPPK